MKPGDREWADLIRRTMAASEPPPEVDLWPRFVRRLDDRRTGVGRLDWVLAAVALTLLAAFPEVMLLVLYHL